MEKFHCQFDFKPKHPPKNYTKTSITSEFVNKTLFYKVKMENMHKFTPIFIGMKCNPDILRREGKKL